MNQLEACLSWLDQLIQREVDLVRRGRSGPADDLRGLYISDAEADRLLAAPMIRPPPLPAGVELPLAHAAERFDLTEDDRALLLVAVAPDLEPRFEALYAYLQDDMNRRRATVGLALRLLAAGRESLWRLRDRLMAGAPLIDHRLLQVLDREELAFMSRPLRTDERIVDEILVRRSRIDRRLGAAVKLVEHPAGEARWVPAAAVAGVHRWRTLWGQAGPRFEPVAVFEGPAVSEAESAAAAIAAGLGRPLLRVDVPALAGSELEARELVALLWREAHLHQAVLLFSESCRLAMEEPRLVELRAALAPALRAASMPVVLACIGRVEAATLFDGVRAVQLGFPMPSYRERLSAWALAGVGSPAREEVSGKFTLSGGQIARAARMAADLASLQGRATGREELLAAARAVSNQGLASLARKLEPVYGWDDIVLATSVHQQLTEIQAAAEHRDRVLVDWGFGERMSRGKGLNVLFSGASGTGKTMAAEVIAHELGLDLYEIDLATVVSKYIGETEKNLKLIFSEAQLSNAILFFDEADALFGKRSEVHHSHDRYSNIEIAYLLQLMEEYEGMAILATNLSRNVDEAFARRMHHVVEFPLPDEALRCQIWARVFPPQAPVGQLDLGFLARRFKLAGGGIRSAALGAAALAAVDGGHIEMRHVAMAVGREYQKLGRLPSQGEFGPYYEGVLEGLGVG